jgi:hypothetical protein
VLTTLLPRAIVKEPVFQEACREQKRVDFRARRGIGFFAVLGFGQAVTLKLAHLNPQQPLEAASAAMAAVFKSEVESGSNGMIKVEIFPNACSEKNPKTMMQVNPASSSPTSLLPAASPSSTR